MDQIPIANQFSKMLVISFLCSMYILRLSFTFNEAGKNTCCSFLIAGESSVTERTDGAVYYAVSFLADPLHVIQWLQCLWQR